jgi:hypothetical protein
MIASGGMGKPLTMPAVLVRQIKIVLEAGFAVRSAAIS